VGDLCEGLCHVRDVQVHDAFGRSGTAARVDDRADPAAGRRRPKMRPRPRAQRCEHTAAPTSCEHLPVYHHACPDALALRHCPRGADAESVLRGAAERTKSSYRRGG
jgi:hypothetical protein